MGVRGDSTSSYRNWCLYISFLFLILFAKSWDLKKNSMDIFWNAFPLQCSPELRALAFNIWIGWVFNITVIHQWATDGLGMFFAVVYSPSTISQLNEGRNYVYVCMLIRVTWLIILVWWPKNFYIKMQYLLYTNIEKKPVPQV